MKAGSNHKKGTRFAVRPLFDHPNANQTTAQTPLKRTGCYSPIEATVNLFIDRNVQSGEELCLRNHI
jgi:hypothetical protein